MLFSIRKAVACGVLALAVLVNGSGALADASFNQGVKLYGQRNFKGAVSAFESSIKTSPWDASAYYYLAMSYHQLGNYTQAKERYKQIVSVFPNTPAAQNAIAALQRLDPDYYRKITGGSTSVAAAAAGSSAAAGDPSLPEAARVYFTRQGNSLIVDAEVNNRSMKMVFDTGAEVCAFGKNHLRALSIAPPEGEASGFASGVGSAGSVKTWNMRVNLKVGGIMRRNFPIVVQENLDTSPLLGQTFFSDYTYVIDNGANSIAFTKKGATRHAGADAYAVPFTREGKEMIVTVQINGRSCPMIFDTGAEGVTFSAGQVKNLGISIPDDATPEVHQGIAGTTNAVSFEVSTMKLGPVEKRNIKIGVVESSNMPKPLLGQSFFGDWQYTIDNQAKLIHFLRR
jgi:clan AA aspartic protease (TIGR02281 family)